MESLLRPFFSGVKRLQDLLDEARPLYHSSCQSTGIRGQCKGLSLRFLTCSITAQTYDIYCIGLTMYSINVINPARISMPMMTE
jgi:hypothetical protein